MPIKLEYAEGESFFFLHVPYRFRTEAREIGGVWDRARKAWLFAAEPGIWAKVKTQFKGRLLVPRRFLAAIEHAEERRNAFLELKKMAEADAPIEYGVEGIALDGENPLFNYQKWGIRCGLAAVAGFLIGDQPGLGKSVQALGIAIRKKQEGEIRNCLIVCPASLKYNWMAEIGKFTQEKAVVIDGAAPERRRKWLAKERFFKIVNYEILVRDLFVNAKAENNTETTFRNSMQPWFDMVIADEIHAIKNHSSQRSQAVKQLKPKFRLGLSGTPVDGKPEELHSIFEFLKPGLFASKSRFLERHAVFDPFGSVKAYVKVEEVRETIAPYCLRRLKANVLQDLPQKLYKEIYVELADTELRQYRELVRGAHEITEETLAATRVLRARQFLDFPEILDFRNKPHKFLALRELLEELIDGNAEKVLIFTQYRQVLELILHHLNGRYPALRIHGDTKTKERLEIVDYFNRSRGYPVLIGTDAMSTGFNIGGADAVIHYDDNYSPAVMQQRNDRAHRATTRHNVTVYRFVCRGTIEQKIRDALGHKMELNNRVLDESCSEFGPAGLTNLELLKYL